MKLYVSLIALLCSIVNAGSILNVKVGDKMTTDFLTGFEGGIFLRNNTQQFEEYGCPEQHASLDEVKAFKNGIKPLKGMAEALLGGKPDETLDQIIDTIFLFVDSFDKFIGVFDEEYSGGEFCAGLTFGKEGAKLLQTIATTLYENHIKYQAKAARSHDDKPKAGKKNKH